MHYARKSRYDALRASISAVVAYNYADEHRDYMAAIAEDLSCVDDHVFVHLRRVAEWLNHGEVDVLDYPGLECPVVDGRWLVGDQVVFDNGDGLSGRGTVADSADGKVKIVPIAGDGSAVTVAESDVGMVSLVDVEDRLIDPVVVPTFADGESVEYSGLIDDAGTTVIGVGAVVTAVSSDLDGFVQIDCGEGLGEALVWTSANRLSPCGDASVATSTVR